MNDVSVTTSTTHAPDDVDDAASPDTPEVADDSPRSPSRLAIGALAVFVAVIRFAYAVPSQIWRITADEPATLGMARWISGTGDWNMFNTPTWRPGLATLIAPLFWITDDLGTIYRGALFINAVIAAISVVFLVRLVQRFTDLDARSTLVVSGVIALMPSSLSASSYAWAEPLVTLSFLASVWYVLRFLDGAGTASAVKAITAAVVGLTFHGRLMALVALVAVATVGWALSRRRFGQAALLAGIAAATSYASLAYTRLVVDRVWEDPAESNSVDAILDRIVDPISVLDAAVGQIWYQLIATVGVFGIGMITVVRAALPQSSRHRVDLPERRDAVVLLLFTVPLGGVSAVFMSDRLRPDHIVYGRYNDAILWPVLAIGAAWLIRSLPSATMRFRLWLFGTIALTTVGFGLFLYVAHGDELSEPTGVPPMVSGIQAFSGAGNAVEPLRATLLGVAAIIVVAAIAHVDQRRSLALGATLAVLLGLGALSTYVAAPDINWIERDQIVSELTDDVVPADETVGVRFIPDGLGPRISLHQQQARVFTYQWYLPDRRFLLDGGTTDDVGPYVFAPDDDPILSPRGVEPIWNDPYSGMALWLE